MKRSMLTLAVALLTSPIVFAAAPARASDIVDTAVAAGSFKTLATALQAAGLISTLKGPGPFTVFAPTDTAFAALPAGTVEQLLKPENKARLTAILTYHVIPARVMAADVAGKKVNPTTVEGKILAVNGMGATIKVNDATVTKPDIVADNGVIHVIDKVLLPK